jgi:hypothetical protein
MGINANTIVTNGDTIAGLKYIARRFVGDCVRAESLKVRSFPGRLRLQMQLSNRAAQSIRQVRKTKQLA